MERGDRVYLRRRTSGEKSFNIQTKQQSQKLDCLKIGPYEIEERLPGDNYKLKLPERMKIHPVFHISLLAKTKNPVSMEDEILDEYEVEEIPNKRTVNGVTEYYIKWKGYGKQDSTWEPTAHLNCPDVIANFESKNQRLFQEQRQRASPVGPSTHADAQARDQFRNARRSRGSKMDRERK
jgi:hypothetical protein